MNSMNQSNLMVMTRYLYVKEEVAVAILTSILDNDPVAIYWAYELYYSGFEEETMELIFKIYYYLFASLNPDVELFIFEKFAEWRTSPSTNAYVINDIMQTLLIRPYDTDVFLLHRMAIYLDYDADVSCLNMSAMSNMDLAVFCRALCRCSCPDCVRPLRVRRMDDCMPVYSPETNYPTQSLHRRAE